MQKNCYWLLLISFFWQYVIQIVLLNEIKKATINKWNDMINVSMETDDNDNWNNIQIYDKLTHLDPILFGLKKRNETLINLNMNQSYSYQQNQNIKPELFIKANTTGVINNIIQYDKQFEKLQQYDKLIRDQKRRQKRFPVEKPEQTKWFQWPGPCNDDNQCPPNLYCVNGSCWHLSNKPIRVQRIHDSSMKKNEQKISDISHLIINPLYRSVGDTVTPSKNTIINLPEFRNSDPFEYTTSTIITTVVTPTTTTTLQQSNARKLKTTINNYYMKRKQSATTTTGSNLIWPSAHKLNLFVDRDNLSRPPFTDLRFPTKSPGYVEYTRQQRFDKPIRIELYLAKAVPQNECSQDSHCGHRMICCRKRWYDLSSDYGIGYFCLPDCKLTKKVSLGMHEANGLIPNDIIYD